MCHVVLKQWYTVFELTGLAVYFFFLKILFLHVLIERGRVGKRKGKKHQCVVASRVPPVGIWPVTQACALDWESNLRSFGSQVSTQSTEPHQPGPVF